MAPSSRSPSREATRMAAGGTRDSDISPRGRSGHVMSPAPVTVLLGGNLKARWAGRWAVASAASRPFGGLAGQARADVSPNPGRRPVPVDRVKLTAVPPQMSSGSSLRVDLRTELRVGLPSQARAVTRTSASHRLCRRVTASTGLAASEDSELELRLAHQFGHEHKLNLRSANFKLNRTRTGAWTKGA